MKKRFWSVRKVVVAAVIAVVAGMGIIMIPEPDDGLVSVLATVRVSRDVIEPLTAVKVDQTTDINEEVLGAMVRGTCHTTGSVHIVLTPNPTEAEFELFLIGQAVSNTVGVSGPAEITSRAVTNFKATKFITFDGDEFLTTPAVVDTKTDLTIENIGSDKPGLRGRIVERVAERQVDKHYEESRRIAAQRVVNQVSMQFDATVQEHLDKLNRDLRLKRLLDGQISNHDKLPMRFRTTKDCFHVSFLAEQGDPRHLPDFKSAMNSPVRVGLNLLALAKNPVKTIEAIRALYNQRFGKKPVGDEETQGKSVLGSDGETFRTVDIGTQEGWIVIHIDESKEAIK